VAKGGIRSGLHYEGEGVTHPPKRRIDEKEKNTIDTKGRYEVKETTPLWRAYQQDPERVRKWV
jgi:hypothetical protein